MFITGIFDIGIYYNKDLNLILSVVNISLLLFFYLFYFKFIIKKFITKLSKPKNEYKPKFILISFYKYFLVFLFTLFHLISIIGIGNFFLYTEFEVIIRSFGLMLYIFGLVSSFNYNTLYKLSNKNDITDIYNNKNNICSDNTDKPNKYIKHNLIRFPLLSSEMLILTGLSLSTLSLSCIIMSALITIINTIQAKKTDDFMNIYDIDYYNYKIKTGLFFPKLIPALKSFCINID